MSSFLFGDELNKEVEELAKSHKLSSKVTQRKCMERYRVPSGRGVRGRGCFNQCAGRGKTPASPFFRARPGPNMVPAESQAVINKDSVESSTEVSQSSVVSIIANQTPFKAGGVQRFPHEWKKITSDPFILGAVNHCHIKFD